MLIYPLRVINLRTSCASQSPRRTSKSKERTTSSKPVKLQNLPSARPKDEELQMRGAIIEDADKTEGKHRDLVHGDGKTLGLGESEDFDHDD